MAEAIRHEAEQAASIAAADDLALLAAAQRAADRSAEQLVKEQAELCLREEY